ncbi:MAG: hypothetical protein AAF546_06300 [Verrucomicrobiota bacterium]
MNQSRRSTVAFIFLALCFTDAVADVLVSWSNSSDNGMTPGLPALDSSLSIGQLSLSQSAGVSADNFNSGSALIGATGLNTTAFDSQRYFEIKMEPNSGYDLSIEYLNIGCRSTYTGTSYWDVRSSLDNFNENLLATPHTQVGAGSSSFRVYFEPNDFKQIGTTISFRIYRWGGGGVTMTTGLRDDTRVVGNIEESEVLISWNSSIDKGVNPGDPNLGRNINGGEFIRAAGMQPGSFASGGAIIAASEMHSTSLDEDKYFEFTITPEAGYTLDIDHLIFVGRSENDISTNWTVRAYVSTDEVEECLFNSGVLTDDGPLQFFLNPLDFGRIDRAVTFRFYGWGQINSNKLMGLYPIGMRVSGETRAAPLVNLDSSLEESEVRVLISEAKSGQTFRIPIGASWTLTKPLVVPSGVSLVGTSFYSANHAANFIKGFDGILCSVDSFATIVGVTFDGSKNGFTGDGLVFGRIDDDGLLVDSDDSINEVMLTNVSVFNCEGSGVLFSMGNVRSIFNNCNFLDNGAYAVEYRAVAGSHDLTRWQSCRFEGNGEGAVLLKGPVQLGVWESCGFSNNGTVFRHADMSHPRETFADRGVAGVSVRDSIIENNAGYLWLHEDGIASGIVFVNCAVIDNGNNISSTDGIIHLADGNLSMEIRGGSEWNNYSNSLFTTSTNSNSSGPSKLTISAGGKSGMIQQGDIDAANTDLIVIDRTLIPAGAVINVADGWYLDPENNTDGTFSTSNP